jgi:hypothetical protein
MATIEDALTQLYRAEIGVEITAFPGVGPTVKIGDNRNGYRAERDFKAREIGQIGDWLLSRADGHRGTGGEPGHSGESAPAGYAGPWRWWGPLEHPDGKREWRWEVVPTFDGPFSGWLDTPQCAEWWDGQKWVGAD